MSVGKTANDGKISIFIKDGVTVHNKKICPHHMQTQTTFHWSTLQTRTLLHSTSAMSRTMATTTRIQKSMPCTQPGKQRLQPPAHRTGNKMDACSVWIPSQIHMDTRHQSGQLCWLANAHGTKCQQILPQNRQDYKRAHEPEQEKCEINENKTSTV